MIVVWGDAGDGPLDRVLAALLARGADVLHIDSAAAASLAYRLSVGTRITGSLVARGRAFEVEQLRGMYVRPSSSSDGGSVLSTLACSLPIPVVNRPFAGRANASKPTQLIAIAAAGLAVPDTLVTTDPDAARAFLHRHQRLVYKSVSGIRSIVNVLGPGDEARLADVATGPVQLQQYIPGTDLRVHVVGDRCFACAIRSSATDYRYAARGGEGVELAPHDLAPALAAQLVALARRMDLLFAGVDLRITPAGVPVCFEVNPSPGFSWYEEATGHPIADAVAQLIQRGPDGGSSSGS